MLRVGLTGGLGSGKSTVAAMLGAHGAHILQADELGRQLMQPGQRVFGEIVSHFGPEVLAADGTLNRAILARLAFTDGRVEELNAIVHPAAIAQQTELAEAIFTRDPAAIVVVESALIFETKYGGPNGWRHRFDKLILVTAPEPLKIARFIARSGPGDPESLAAEARRRLASQITDAEKAPACDFIVHNDGTLEDLQRQVDDLWPKLLAASRQPTH
ncbi:dephospho-CoA kinase [Granulicella sp. WH15]|nr:dephospho-CoA kinase [Granulicella sp. WH15]